MEKGTEVKGTEVLQGNIEPVVIQKETKRMGLKTLSRFLTHRALVGKRAGRPLRGGGDASRQWCFIRGTIIRGHSRVL